MTNVVAAFGTTYPGDPRSGVGIKIEKRGLYWKTNLDYGNVPFSITAPQSGLITALPPNVTYVAFDLASLPNSGPFISSLLTGAVPAGYPLRRSKFLVALEAVVPGSVARLRDAVPADPGATARLAWDNILFFSSVGPFAQFVKSTIPLTDDQFAAVVAVSRAITE